MTAIAHLYVDWDNDGTFNDANEDITGDLRAVSCARGRDRDSSITGRSSAGRLTAVLNNLEGQYSPFNGASPLAGSLKPGRRVRLAITPTGGIEKSVWTGFINSIVPEIQVNRMKTATIEAWGGLAKINEAEIRLEMLTGISTGAAINAILDEAGWDASDRVIDTGKTTMSRFWIDKRMGIDALRVVENTESGFIVEAPDGDIRFEDRHHRQLSPHTVSQATFSDAVGSALRYRQPQEDDPFPYIHTRYEADIPVFTLGALAPLWTLAETGPDSPVIRAGGRSRTFIAIYPSSGSAAGAVGVDAWTTPVAVTDYTANADSDGTGIDLTGDIAVATVKSGNRMEITLTNNHAGQDAAITFLQARGTPVLAGDPVGISASDPTSEFGIRTFRLSDHFIPSTLEGQAWAEANLSVFKEPIPYIRFEMIGNLSAAHEQAIVDLDISDRVTFVANSGETLMGISEDFFIEHIALEFDMDRILRATYRLSPARAFGAFWILGTSQLGTGTRLGY